ncbi:uncharacterized protein LOC133191539 [Saccostrea echinata]|uniref:uncharacterized protein LOC133191539 n=1 Tax=Saccostrea echinata TaxID=191078 RepID=UPI002A803485|nr:uncharacterized protein LOC133191539 [Saccostrea echinata]
METPEIVKLLGIIFCFMIVIVGTAKVLKVYSSFGDPVLKKITNLVIIISAISCVLRLVALSTALIYGGWPFDDLGCQLYGFVDLVVYSGSTWILCIAAMERYFKFMLQVDHPSTFSVKNVNMIVVGIFILIILIATGPLYGLGEYSYYRGHLKLSLSYYPLGENGTTNHLLFPSWYSYLLKNEIDKRTLPNPTYLFRKTFEENLRIKVVQLRQTEVGFDMFFRCPSLPIAEELWYNHTTGSLGEVFKSIVWHPELSQTLNVKDVIINTTIDEQEYEDYMNVFLISQDLGMCGTDWTSKNVHALVWSVYQTIITTAAPFILEAILYIIISCKNPCSVAVTDKHIREHDIRALRFFQSSSVIYFLLTSSYFTITIINLNGVYIPSIVIFLTSLLYFTSSVSILIGCFVVECEPFSRFNNAIQNCWKVCRGKFSRECAEISIKTSTLYKMKQRTFREPKTYV